MTGPVDEWRALAALFPGGEKLASAVEAVSAAETPAPYDALLAHNGHMTAMVERFYGTPVDVRVLARRIDDSTYSREIVLTRRDTGTVVQFALARYDLHAVSTIVRDEILSEQVPIGRVLLNHGVNCRVELGGLLKISIGPELAAHLQASRDGVTYGRIARLICDDTPAFLVGEVLAPVTPR